MNLDNISPPADKAIKYPNIPDYQPDIELKRDINMQFLQPEEINNYDADVNFHIILEFHKKQKIIQISARQRSFDRLQKTIRRGP